MGDPPACQWFGGEGAGPSQGGPTLLPPGSLQGCICGFTCEWGQGSGRVHAQSLHGQFRAWFKTGVVWRGLGCGLSVG